MNPLQDIDPQAPHYNRHLSRNKAALDKLQANAMPALDVLKSYTPPRGNGHMKESDYADNS